MNNEQINEVNKNIVINNIIGITTFILFVISHAMKSIVLLSATILLATVYILLVVKYYQYASNKKQVVKNFRKVKWQSTMRLVSAIGFMIMSIILIHMYTQ